MTLQSSGALSLGDVNVELGLSRTAQISLGGASARGLYGVASGAIRLAADGYGKSSIIAGQLWSWGFNAVGQLADNTTTSRSSPVQILGGGSTWSKLNTGCGYRNTTASIKTDGTLWNWGNVYLRGLFSSPVQIIGGGTNWKEVSHSYYHQTGVKTDGTLWTSGENYYGQLGDNTTNSRLSPGQTVSGGTNWSTVSAGVRFTGAIKTDGTLWTWGRGDYGQLGNNSTASRSSPVQTVSGGTNWKFIACGLQHIASIKTDGTLWSWGGGGIGSGQLGNNSAFGSSSPVQTVSGGTNWKSASCGENTTQTIKTDGTLWCWGDGGFGRLGNNDSSSYSSPIQTVSGGTNWSTVSAGRSHTSAVKTDGTLWSWGNGGFGGLGTNNTTDRSSPVQTVSGGTNWKLTSSGTYFTAAIKT